MNAFTEAINALALKLGEAIGLSAEIAALSLKSKLLLLFLVITVPFGIALLLVWLVVRNLASVGRKAQKGGIWAVAEISLTLPVFLGLLLIGVAAWMAHDHLRETRLSIAAGLRTEESYKLAQTLKLVTERQNPRIKMTLLEINAGTNDAGFLENGIIQLCLVPGDIPPMPNARSVATLTGSAPHLLLARDDVDERVVYALTQTLTQFSNEFTPAAPTEKDAPKVKNVTIQKPDAAAGMVLHRGAAAFYDRDKTWFIFRYARLSALVTAAIVLIGLWIWRARRRTPLKPEVQTVSFSPPTEREPWTFAKILREIPK